jgi:hypothetical protein
VCVGTISLVLIYWLVNWFTHFTLKIKIHFCLTAVYVLAVAWQALFYGIIMHWNRNGTGGGALRIVYVTASSLYNICLFTVLFLAARGWYIVRTDIKWKNFFAGVGCIGAYVVAGALVSEVTLGFWALLIIALGIAGLSGYIYLVTHAVRSSSAYVLAHMLVIEGQGIDPKSTPIFRKFQMLQLFFKLITVYCVLTILAIFANMFLKLLWLGPFLYFIVDLYMCCGLAWLLSLRKDLVANYMMLDGDEADNGVLPITEFGEEEIERMTINMEEFSRGGRQYEYGMRLPPPPIIREGGPPSVDHSSPPQTSQAMNPYDVRDGL